MNQMEVMLMLAEQAEGRQSIDPEHALALLCRQIAELDPNAESYGKNFGELIEIGVTLLHQWRRGAKHQ